MAVDTLCIFGWAAVIREARDASRRRNHHHHSSDDKKQSQGEPKSLESERILKRAAEVDAAAAGNTVPVTRPSPKLGGLPPL